MALQGAAAQGDRGARLLLCREPRLAFLSLPTRAEPQLSALAEQSWRPVHLDTSFTRELGEPPEPYERLLHAAIAVYDEYFAREDSVEET